MKKNGFTLLEIMITVSVISLLAGLASYAVMKGVNSSRIKQAETELEMLSVSILQLAHDTARWPNRTYRTGGGSTEIWKLSGNRFGLEGTDGFFNNWKGPYYDGTMLDPWGNPYFFDPDYTIREDRSIHVVVGSFGPNGVGPNRYDKDDIYILLDD